MAIYTMYQLIDRLGIELMKGDYLPDCPFCHKKRTLHIKASDNSWRCVSCGSHGGVLRFFAKWQLNEELPSDKSERQKFSEKLAEFMGDDSITAAKPIIRQSVPRVRLAPDKVLHAVYSEVMNIASLALTDTDKTSLMKRGLSEEAIARNGYRSLPASPTIPEPYSAMYQKLGGDREFHAIFEDKYYSKSNVLVGLMIASYVESKGLDPKGVPGFYKFGGKWCFWSHPGILIPTRNIRGQIVAFQVRQNRAPKYMTLHCASLPGAVTETASRCHFPIGNAELSPDIPVLFTEGPLKADAAQHLMGKPCVFVAIPGVQNTKDLLRNVPALERKGVSVMYNALDMDRYTNPNVAKGSQTLCAELQKRGIFVKEFCWGAQYASYKLALFNSLCTIKNIPVPAWKPGVPVHSQLWLVNQALLSSGIEPCKILIPGQKAPNHTYWESETKGIDDYLLYRNSK